MLAPIESHTLLSAEAQRLVWLEHTPDIPEIDFAGLYPRIADAWRVVHDWRLAQLLEQFDDNENHRLFRDWSELYMQTARQRSWITEAELPAAIRSAVQARRVPAETLLLLGFDVMPPSLERMLGAYRSMGATIYRFEPARAETANVDAVSCNDPEQELRAAIYWARAALSATSEPNRSASRFPICRDRTTRSCDSSTQFCDPNEVEPTAATSPYNISGGVPLSSVPVVADALDFLEWLFEPYHHTRIDSLIRSPFLRLSHVSIADDHRQPERCDAAQFAALAFDAPLREIVQQASRLGLRDLSGVVAGARQLLDLVGWPNTGRLSSESFQAYRSFDALLDELAANSEFVQPRHVAATLRQLRIAADRRLFAPERPRATIQVLGYLETLGLEFTHLWVTGLSQLEWPRSPSPTPFIPMRHLKAASVARSDVAAEVAFARRLMVHWRASSASVIFSYPIVRNELPSRRSVLIDECAPTADMHFDAPELTWSHPYLAGRVSLEARDDIEVLPADIGRLRHRGTGIIRDQSACPFRAFARYRLHAPQRTAPHSFPDATDRGVATHAALRSLFEKLAATEPGTIDEAALEVAVTEAATTAIAGLGPLPTLFRASERERMKALLFDWLTLERQRRPHRIVANEAVATLVLSGIEFDLRIDRIDANADGSLLVIDYKTGPASPNVVIGARLEEPQLPMYALSVPGVMAIAFGLVRPNDCRLSGWSTANYSAAQSDERVRFNPVGGNDDGWDALLDDWRESLAGLAAEFRNGVSRVQPRDAGVCDECNLHALCRIREQRRIELD